MAAVAPDNYNRFAYWNRLAWNAKTVQEMFFIAQRSYEILSDEEKSLCSYSDWYWSYWAVWESICRDRKQPTTTGDGDSSGGDDDTIPL